MSAAIADDAVERLRRRLGIPARWLDRPRNTVASADSIHDFSIGCGDDNPLYLDADYGASSRWGENVAPPLYFITTGTKAPDTWSESEAEAMSGGDPLRGVGQYLTSERWEMLAPVVAGVRLFRERHLHAVEERASTFGGGRVVVLTNRVSYADEQGRIYAINDRTYHHAEKTGSSKSGKYRDIEIAPYTDEQIDAIGAAYDAEWRRGADVLTVDSVAVGDELPTIVKGPLTLTDVICYHVGIGMGGTGGALRLAHQTRQRVPGWFTRNALNVPDLVQRCHWEDDYARQLGQPAAYDYGMMRTNWAVQCVTNWMGDDAWVRTVDANVRRFNYIGDTQWISGRVTAMHADDPTPSIDIEIEGRNQRDEVTCTATATVLVADRAGSLATLPAAFVRPPGRCECRREHDR